MFQKRFKTRLSLVSLASILPGGASVSPEKTDSASNPASAIAILGPEIAMLEQNEIQKSPALAPAKERRADARWTSAPKHRGGRPIQLANNFAQAENRALFKIIVYVKVFRLFRESWDGGAAAAPRGSIAPDAPDRPAKPRPSPAARAQ